MREPKELVKSTPSPLRYTTSMGKQIGLQERESRLHQDPTREIERLRKVNDRLEERCFQYEEANRMLREQKQKLTREGWILFLLLVGVSVLAVTRGC